MLEYADETGLINDDPVNNLMGLISKMSQSSSTQSQGKMEKKEKMKILNDEL